MIGRRLHSQIVASLETFPALALVGSRQVGKTTLARALPARDSLYIDPERPSDLARLADAESYLEHHAARLVIMDEAQRRPDIFPLLRALIDADRAPGGVS